MFFRPLVVVFTLLFSSISLHSDETGKLASVLEATVPHLMDAHHVPGVSMVLIRDHRIVWTKAFGVKVAGATEKVDENTVFEAASMSKPLYTYAVLKLVEKGKLDLDRPLDSYLPEPYLPEDDRAKKITGRMVMLHRTGLPNWRKGGWRSGNPLKVLHEPGSRFTYSGEGYLYLQKAVERLTGTPLEKWIKASLLTPLQMTRSGYRWQERFKADYAGGHDREGKFKEKRRFYQRANAAYSLYTTPTDYARYLLEMMREDRSAPHSLCTETIGKMTTLQSTPEKNIARTYRGLGWVVGTESDAGWVSHSGTNGSGFRCHARFNMKTGSGSVVMTNSLSGNRVWGAIVEIIDAITTAEEKKENKRAEAVRSGILVAGGDTVLARWEHDMVVRNGFNWPLAGVAPLIASADTALCNLECCISRRGAPVDKGERCSFYYRARPEMLTCLTEAGIDIVTAANNHAGDYGPVSVADTATWCEKAGLVCVGNGNNDAEAQRPKLVKIGGLVVAVAGMDATTSCFAAEAERAGVNYAPPDDELKIFTRKMQHLGGLTRDLCDLLILTIHWGPNWPSEPKPVHRKMARIAFENGVDLILGHSAHRLQGIEIIDGKPVVYDMGNLLFDCKLKKEGRDSALFRLHLSAKGVRKIEVLPLQAKNGHTVQAEGAEAESVLSEMCRLCAALGTSMYIEKDDKGGRQRGVVSIAEPKATARPEKKSDAFCTNAPLDGEAIIPAIPKEVLVDTIPKTAKRFTPSADVAENIQLLACNVPENVQEGGILFITTYWRVAAPVDKNLLLAYHIRPDGETPRRGTPWYTRHDPGDWSAPLALLKPGQVVRDFYPARLAGLPPGSCRVYALVLDTTRDEGARVLGTPTYLGTCEIVPAGNDG